MRRTGRWMAAGALCAASGCAFFGGGSEAETPAQAAERAAGQERIAREVEARLAAEPSIGPGRVRPVVEGREVHLHGSVAGFGALQCARANAELVPGVGLVVDFLVLQPGPSRVDCLAPRVFSSVPRS